MDISAFSNLVFATDQPVLPTPGALRLAMPVLWAIVLGAAAVLAARRWARPYRVSLMVLVAIWALLPGPVSPAYWLSLAFQTPSLMSALIGLGWAIHELRTRAVAVVRQEPARRSMPSMAMAVGIFLGWVLLLDTMAWSPLSASVYAWGFSGAAVGAMAVVVALLWAAMQTKGEAARNYGASGRATGLALLLVVPIFVLTRLPTGNVWDAVLDPWLWFALQAVWLVNAVRRWRMRAVALAAIRV